MIFDNFSRKDSVETLHHKARGTPGVAVLLDLAGETGFVLVLMSDYQIVHYIRRRSLKCLQSITIAI